MLNWLRLCLAAWMDGGTVKWLSSRVPVFTGWLTGLHSKSCLPLWLQCEVFHVLSAPTICFYKAAPPLHVGLFILYPLLLSPSFPSSFFTLSYSLFISPSCFPFFHSNLSSILPIAICLYSDLPLHLSSILSRSQHAPHPSLHLHVLQFIYRALPFSFPFTLLVLTRFSSRFHLPFLSIPSVGKSNTHPWCVRPSVRHHPGQHKHTEPWHLHTKTKASGANW